LKLAVGFDGLDVDEQLNINPNVSDMVIDIVVQKNSPPKPEINV
jgi:hypothetical protein